MNEERRIAELERQVRELTLQRSTGVGASQISGATEVRQVQTGAPATLTGPFNTTPGPEAGYPWVKNLINNQVPGVVSDPIPDFGFNAYTPGNDETLLAGQTGWLEVNRQADGWIFIPSGSGAPSYVVKLTASDSDTPDPNWTGDIQLWNSDGTATNGPLIEPSGFPMNAIGLNGPYVPSVGDYGVAIPDSVTPNKWLWYGAGAAGAPTKGVLFLTTPVSVPAPGSVDVLILSGIPGGHVYWVSGSVSVGIQMFPNTYCEVTAGLFGTLPPFGSQILANGFVFSQTNEDASGVGDNFTQGGSWSGSGWLDLTTLVGSGDIGIQIAQGVPPTWSIQRGGTCDYAVLYFIQIGP
jgi:hypothetical protein